MISNEGDQGEMDTCYGGILDRSPLQYNSRERVKERQRKEKERERESAHDKNENDKYGDKNDDDVESIPKIVGDVR